MGNVFRQALDILQRGDEMTAEESHLVGQVLAFAANELPKAFPVFEEMDLREILKKIMQEVGDNDIREAS
ncbi:hypothetical protein ES708_26418 [subsurface metagenome]